MLCYAALLAIVFAPILYIVEAAAHIIHRLQFRGDREFSMFIFMTLTKTKFIFQPSCVSVSAVPY